MAKRIVSLVPSLTQTACDLGLQSQVVGCTTFCVEPPSLRRTAAAVGGTKDPDLERILALRPTHVLVNEEENKPEHIAALAAAVPTLRTFPRAPADVPGMLREAGRFLGAEAAAEAVARDTEAALTALRHAASGGGGPRRRFLYYIWREPDMVAGPDTYISRMLEAAGLANAAAGEGGSPRYPETPLAAAKALAPDLLLLSSEPYPFRRRDAERLRGAWPDAPEILWIDGQRLSWYGTTTAAALRDLAAWVRGEDCGALVRPLTDRAGT